MDEQMQCVFVANGEIHAQQVRAFLEAAGISTLVHGEALRHTHGLTLNGLGTVQQGYVETSNVNVVEELVQMIQTQRAYELNSKAIQTSDQMLQKLAQL